MTARKVRPFRTLDELQRLLEQTPASDKKACIAIRVAIRYRTDLAFRLKGINRSRAKIGCPPATSLDDVDCRADRMEQRQ